MHRPGADTDAMLPTDILCDFCTRPWTDEIPMVEGHQGSCICGDCLTTAWRAVIDAGIDDAPPQSAQTSEEGEPAWKCSLCLEAREDPAFRSPIREEALVCRRCIRLAGRALDSDPDHAWNKPSSGAVSERGTNRTSDPDASK